jgi:hypothetical protein
VTGHHQRGEFRQKKLFLFRRLLASDPLGQVIISKTFHHLGCHVDRPLRKRDAAHITPKAKCPFTPQREMVLNLFGENLP